MNNTNITPISSNMMNSKSSSREVINFGEPIPLSKVPDRTDDFNDIISSLTGKEQVALSQILYKPNGIIEVSTFSTTKQMRGMMKTDIHNLQRQWRVRSRLRNKLNK